jgi:CheY-like chemotaxis protein
MPCTVLLVEDVDDVRELTKAVLEEAGLVVGCAANGREALAWLSLHQPPCLIFLDLQMPEMSGWELADHLAASPQWAVVPIVVVSAWSASPRRPMQAREFLTKPTPLDRLLGATRHCHLHHPATAS